MKELIKILISTVVLILAVPIGNILRKYTKDELRDGQKWFKVLTVVCLMAGFAGLIVRKDWIMFSAFFVALVTIRSLVFGRSLETKT